MSDFLITENPIDPARMADAMRNPSAGALVVFEGWIRNQHDGREVTGLDYEAFTDMATAQGEQLLLEAKNRYSITGANAVHRTGALSIGDCAIWVGVTAAHRQEAFLACRWIMDTVKERLPIWKKEFYASGDALWVHAGEGSATTASDAATDQYYKRQVSLPVVGVAGQRRLANSRVLVVGAGGLGCPALQYLTAAGVGHLTIVDGDRVELSNLHRQILFGMTDIGRNKATAAAEKLRQLNPNVSFQAVDDAATVETLPALLENCDLVLDGTDNFESKYTIHDLAWQAGVPIIQASVYQLDGLVQVFDPRQPQHGCFRCLWPEAPPVGTVCNCAEAGVLGVTPGLIGTYQATEAIKYLLGAEGQLGPDTLHVNVLDGTTFRIRRSPRKDCCCQGKSAWPRLPSGLLFPGRKAQLLRSEAMTIDLREADERLQKPCKMSKTFHAPREAWQKLLQSVESLPVVLCCASGVRARQCLRELGSPDDWYAWTQSIEEWAALNP